MKSTEIIFILIIYILSFTSFMVWGFQNFQEILWLKIIMSALISIIPTAFLGFFFVTITRKTFGKEMKALVVNVTGKPKKVDKVFFLISYLLFIPAIIIINKYPLLIGAPLVLAGLYGLIFGRIFTKGFSLLFFHFYSGGFARVLGIMQIIIGIGISIGANMIFPLP